MSCRRRRRSRAAEDFVQSRVVSFQVRNGVIHRHAALLEKSFRLPLVQPQQFADLPVRKASGAITLNRRVFHDVTAHRVRRIPPIDGRFDRAFSL